MDRVSALKIFGAILLTYLPFAGWMSVPLTGDQKVYLSTALEMDSAGSTLIPLLFGEPSYYKPPLQYWATIAGIRNWGYSLFGAMLPSVLVGLVAALSIAWIGSRLVKGPRAGLWFLASLGTATYALTAQMEIYLVAANSLCWAFALHYLDREPLGRLRSPWALYAAWLVAGLGAWVKSPLYSALWGIGFWIHLAFNREWREFRNPHHWLAFVLGSLVGASWYAVILHLDGESFMAQYLVRETVEKSGGNGLGILGLWQALPALCMPWATLALLGALRFLRAGSRRLTGFVLGSTLPPAIFFSAFPYRISPYLYVLVPTLAILVAWIEGEGGRLLRWTQRLTAICMALAMAYVAWVGMRARIFPPVINVATILVAAAWISCWTRPRALLASSLALVAWYHLAAVNLGERDLNGLRDYVEQNPHRVLSMLDDTRNIWHEVGLLSLAIRKPIERLMDLDEVVDALEEGQAVVLSAEQGERFGDEIRRVLKEDGEERGLEVVHWRRLSTRRQLPIKELLRAKRQLEFERDFQILTLAPDMERLVPEGGV